MVKAGGREGQIGSREPNQDEGAEESRPLPALGIPWVQDFLWVFVSFTLDLDIQYSSQTNVPEHCLCLALPQLKIQP